MIHKLQNYNSEKYNALVTVITGLIWSVKFNCHLFSTRTTINAQKKAKIMLLKILTYSMAGCLSFGFDGYFVKCFPHVSSVIIPLQKPTSNLRNCYSAIRRNRENKILCRQKDIVFFEGGAFSLDMGLILIC